MNNVDDIITCTCTCSSKRTKRKTVPRPDHLCYDNEKKQVGIATAREPKSQPNFPRLDGFCHDNEKQEKGSMYQKAESQKSPWPDDVCYDKSKAR